ncbi:MAG: F0F1 ATP synthase subunit A [Firmicutes bacterium]|nr:F0F1 ATP synthase subunit A [Bacillota bacterium]
MSTHASEATQPVRKKSKTGLIIVLVLAVIALNVVAGKYLGLNHGIEINIFPRPVEGFGGGVLTETNISMFVASALIVVSALIIRIFFIPKFKAVPGKVQNVLELIVGTLENYASSISGVKDAIVPAYGLTVGAVIVFSGFAELLGFRAPTTDFLMNAALALIALIVINIVGIRKFGFPGRVKSFFKPVPMVGPILIVTHLLIPVSLTFRLFGNILGGMIVLELLYAVTPLVVPGILNSFFVLFHAGMQTFVFITLMFTYVNEAAEEPHD